MGTCVSTTFRSQVRHETPTNSCDCLHYFSGCLHAHISYLDDPCDVCLVLLTVNPEQFQVLSNFKQLIGEVRERSIDRFPWTLFVVFCADRNWKSWIWSNQSNWPWRSLAFRRMTSLVSNSDTSPINRVASVNTRRRNSPSRISTVNSTPVSSNRFVMFTDIYIILIIAWNTSITPPNTNPSLDGWVDDRSLFDGNIFSRVVFVLVNIGLRTVRGLRPFCDRRSGPSMHRSHSLVHQTRRESTVHLEMRIHLTNDF